MIFKWLNNMTLSRGQKHNKRDDSRCEISFTDNHSKNKKTKRGISFLFKLFKRKKWDFLWYSWQWPQPDQIEWAILQSTIILRYENSLKMKRSSFWRDWRRFNQWKIMSIRQCTDSSYSNKIVHIFQEDFIFGVTCWIMIARLKKYGQRVKVRERRIRTLSWTFLHFVGTSVSSVTDFLFLKPWIRCKMLIMILFFDWR